MTVRQTESVLWATLLLLWVARLPLRQLSDVAEGLNYLHSRNVLHRGLKGVCDRSKVHRAIVLTPGPWQSSILMDSSGHARIASIDVATVTQDRDYVQGILDEYTARWTAPEILNGQGTYSKEADIFSFAMVMIEARMDYCMLIFGLLLFRINAGLHWRGAVQRESTRCGYVGNNGWQAPTTAGPSNLHRRVVDVDPTLLESGPSLAPRSFRSFASFA